MIIALGTDHRGFAHKEFIKKNSALAGITVQWLDVGAHTADRSDYPVFAKKVCELMQQGKVERAVLICGSGVGMVVAANRFKGIYAALAWNDVVARLCVEHDNANILVLPSDFVTQQQALTMTGVWLQSKFNGGRYQQRLDQIDALGGV